MLNEATADEKILQIAEYALQSFSERGYRHTRMADIAKRMKFSEPALYRYVESKEALIYMAFRRAIDLDDYVPSTDFPFQTAGRDEVVALVGDFLAYYDPATLIPARGHTPVDAKAEFQGLVHKLYDLFFTYKQAIRLFERIGLEWPEIYTFWYEQTRPAFFNGIARYVGLRAEQGCFVAYGDNHVASSIFTETLVQFAVGRHFDPVPIRINEEDAEGILVAALTRMFVLKE